MVSGDYDARPESLDVPFPRSRQGLVEIADIEEDVALRRGETAEIHDVSVAAGLHGKAGPRGRGQIGSHDRGCAAIEGEGRLGHAPKANRDQFRNSALVGLAQ
jgi:hypothetical protein